MNAEQKFYMRNVIYRLEIVKNYLKDLKEAEKIKIKDECSPLIITVLDNILDFINRIETRGDL